MGNMEHSMDEVPGTSTTSYEEAGRGCRSKKKHLDPSLCPVCSCTLRSTDVHQHLNCEIEKLEKINICSKQLNGKRHCISPTNNNSTENGSDKHWETYQKVRTNRQCRQKSKSRKRRSEESICPVCNSEVSEDINIHVEKCLRRSGQSDGESDENIDVEACEEYEWAGQSRVRATSLLQGGLSSLGTSLMMTEEDEDLVVDGDDTQLFGVPQYTERDIILPDLDKERDPLRKAVLGGQSAYCVSEKQIDQCAGESNSLETGATGDPVVEALKSRIRELESRNKQEVYKCLICMERYRTPVISVCCWHVHCESCWLQTLGAKKLCPQCNMITSASDLRKIYM